MEQNDVYEVYKTIKNFRELKNITRESMADALNITVSGYSKIERGETDIQLSRLYKIAEILNVELYQLLNFKLSTVFNFNESKNIQASNEKMEMNIYNDIYLEKYTKKLEEEIERLKHELNHSLKIKHHFKKETRGK
jgi:transcriptional regulator with XRE-family HTH domain